MHAHALRVRRAADCRTSRRSAHENAPSSPPTRRNASSIGKPPSAAYTARRTTRLLGTVLLSVAACCAKSAWPVMSAGKIDVLDVEPHGHLLRIVREKRACRSQRAGQIFVVGIEKGEQIVRRVQRAPVQRARAARAVARRMRSSRDARVDVCASLLDQASRGRIESNHRPPR